MATAAISVGIGVAWQPASAPAKMPAITHIMRTWADALIDISSLTLVALPATDAQKSGVQGIIPQGRKSEFRHRVNTDFRMESRRPLRNPFDFPTPLKYNDRNIKRV